MQKKKKKWIDTRGRNHMLTYDDTDGCDAKEDGHHADFDPGEHFSQKEECW